MGGSGSDKTAAGLSPFVQFSPPHFAVAGLAHASLYSQPQNVSYLECYTPVLYFVKSCFVNSMFCKSSFANSRFYEFRFCKTIVCQNGHYLFSVRFCQIRGFFKSCFVNSKFCKIRIWQIRGFTNSSFAGSWFYAWRIGYANSPKRPDTSVLPMQNRCILGYWLRQNPRLFTGLIHDELALPIRPGFRLCRIRI